MHNKKRIHPEAVEVGRSAGPVTAQMPRRDRVFDDCGAARLT